LFFFFYSTPHTHDAKQLLLKNILSPKCISSILKSLSPGVNLHLYHHSTETETHIYFIPKTAKFFDLLGFSRQETDRLNGIPFVPQKLRNFPAILEHRKIQANPL